MTHHESGAHEGSIQLWVFYLVVVLLSRGSLLCWRLTVGRIELHQVEGEIIHLVTVFLLGTSDATQYLSGCPWAVCTMVAPCTSGRLCSGVMESLKEKRRNRAQGQPWVFQASPFKACEEALTGCVHGLSLHPSTWS